MKAKLLVLVLALSLSGFLTYAQTTYVPDDDFENYLETHNANGAVVPLGDPTSMGDGIAGNDLVTTAKISGVTVLDLEDSFAINIYDLEGIQDFTSLQILDIRINPISILKLPSGNNLLELYCSTTDITSFDISNHTALTKLVCSGLTDLDVTSNVNLTSLSCSFSTLGSLDVSNNTALTTLTLRDCSLNTLDLSNNTALTSLNCIENNLTSLNLAANTNLTQIFCYENYSLTSLTLPSTPTLTKLECFDSALTDLDVSNNPNLDYLSTGYNNLTSLDLSNNTVLSYLNCQRQGDYTIFTSLILPNSPNLYFIICDNNNLTSLDISNNPGLTGLFCHWNQITSLDFNNNPLLERVWCYGNDLSSLNVASNSLLWQLDCGINALPSLDVSNNPNLTELYCNENLLTSLNLKNGANGIMNWMWAQDNPSLTCIQVDDVAQANAKPNWTKDAGASYNTNCALGIDEFNESSLALFPNPAKNKFTIDINIDAKYSLISTQGQELRTGTLLSGINELDINSLSNGLYFLNIETPEGKATKKLIKE